MASIATFHAQKTVFSETTHPKKEENRKVGKLVRIHFSVAIVVENVQQMVSLKVARGYHVPRNRCIDLVKRAHRS